MVRNHEEPPIQNPVTQSDRLLLVEWRLKQIEATLNRFTMAAWTVAATVIGGVAIYVLSNFNSGGPS